MFSTNSDHGLILGGLALVVAYKLLASRIAMDGLLDSKVSHGPSPGRAQLPFLMGAVVLFRGPSKKQRA